MRMLPLTAAVLFCSLFTSALCAPPQAGQERTWTGVNGKAFLGVFSRTFDDGEKKVEFLTSAGKVVTVAFDNLSEKDREIILVLEGKAPTKPAPVNTQEFFKALPVADRTKIPTLKPEDFGGSDEESMVDALWISLLWWDSTGIVPVPKSGDFDRKADWLHGELSRNISKGGKRAATLNEAADEIGGYFDKRLEIVGTCKREVFLNPEPATLAKMATGNTVVVLRMTMVYANGGNYSVVGALESMEDDGSFVIHFFGERFSGKLSVSNVKDPRDRSGKSYEFKLADREKIPDRYKDQEATFFLMNNGWNGALVMTPYIYKTPGEKAPIPGVTSP